MKTKSFAGFKTKIWWKYPGKVENIFRKRGCKRFIRSSQIVSRMCNCKSVENNGFQSNCLSHFTEVTVKIPSKSFDFAMVMNLLKVLKFLYSWGKINWLQRAILRLHLLNGQQELWKVSYRYMEDYGYKYIHRLLQLVSTLKSAKSCWIELVPKNENFWLSVIFPQQTNTGMLKSQVWNWRHTSHIQVCFTFQ